ncbi:MAG: fibronectin type III domain-containing protein, partial [Cyclobacteriaceae bacterium]
MIKQLLISNESRGGLGKIFLFAIVMLVMTYYARAQGSFYGKIPGINEYSRSVFWYGQVSSTQMATLKTFDLVILEPTLRVVNVGRNEFYMESLTPSQVEELKRGVDGNEGTADDVIVLAYISIGEMLSTIIPGSSGHMTVQKGIELGLLPENYAGPSGPAKGPNPWDFTSSGGYIDTEQSGVNPDGTYDDGFDGYVQLDIASDYSSWGSRLKWRNQGVMPWYMDQQGTWVTDARYLYGGYWKSGDNIVDVNPTYGGGYINAGDPAWRKFIAFRIEKLVKDCGFDGVFLDTYDTPDPVGGASPSLSWGPRGNFAWTAKGMVELIEMIKEVDPSKVVASNRGYWMLNPQEGTSQFADRYRKAMNIFVTESWYHNPYITSGSKFYDENPAFLSNWNTDPQSAGYQSRDNFGGYWKEYMNAQANQQDGFHILIIDFQVTEGAKIEKWMGEVVENSGYLGYAVHNANHFNAGISEVAKDWLEVNNYPEANLSGFHSDNYQGFGADGDFSEWSSETPVFSDPSGGNAKSITKVYTKFVNDRFFMMVESDATLSLSGESIYFDFDQNGASGWDVWWPVTPDAKLYFESDQQVNLFPHLGPGDVFAFPNAVTNRAWPVKVAHNNNKWEIEFEKDFIFGAENANAEIWTWFRQANFGGSSIQFDVPPDGPAIADINASSVDDNTETITWTTDVPSSSEVVYGLTPAYGSSVSNSSLVTNHSLTLSNLTKGTTYHFKVVSEDAGNRESESSNQTFTTTDATAPPVISNISVESLTRNSALITWETDQSCTGRVDFGTTSGYGQNQTASGSTTEHTITLTGLNAETTYHFQVSATNAQNITATSADDTFTTLEDLSISSISAQVTNASATIAWSSNTPSDSRVDYGTATSYGSTVTDASLTTTHSLTITGLSPGTTYHYKVTSEDSQQSTSSTDLTFTTSVFNTITVDGNASDWTGVPAIATGGPDLVTLKVTEGQNHLYVLVEGQGISSSTRRLLINADNNGSTGMTDYFTWTGAGVDYMIESELQYQSAGTGWSWSGMSNTYIDVAFNASVYEIAIEKSSMTNFQLPCKLGFTLNNTTAQLPQSSTVMATFNGNTGGGGNPPGAPSNLSVTTISPSELDLAWTDNSSDETGFKIERSPAGGGSFQLIETTGANATSFSDTGLAAATSYEYRVYAFNAAGSSDYSNTSTGLTSETPAAPSNLSLTVASASQINLAWTDNTSSETGYKVERSTNGGSFTEIATLGANVDTYEDTGLVAETSYTYRVRAYNGAGNSDYSNEETGVTLNTPPPAPSNLSVSVISSTQVNLSWSDNASNEDGFSIEESVNGGSYVAVASVSTNTTSYSRTGLTASTPYSYRVRAYNSGGNSAYSNTASGTTSGGGPTIITIDGSLSDWSGETAIATASGQSALSLKVFDDNDKLYFGISGSGMSSVDYQVFIDADNNSSTGYQDSRFTSSGAEYLLENGSLFVSTGSGWSWSGVSATVQQSKSSSVTELSVNKSDFSALASTIRVAYADMVNWAFASKLPASGGYASYALQAVPSFGGITIDGSSSDWSPVASVASGSGITLKAYSDASNIYLSAIGSLNNAYQFFIDVDNNGSTGFQDASWSSSGIDYMIENGTLYQHAGGGWSWTLVGTLSAAHNTGMTEILIVKSSLANLAGTI